MAHGPPILPRTPAESEPADIFLRGQGPADVNVLLPAYRQDVPRHEAYRDWLE